MRRPGIEPGPHAWKARILTIELSSLKSCVYICNINKIKKSPTVGLEPTAT